jgi:hypothetical protein
MSDNGPNCGPDDEYEFDEEYETFVEVEESNEE